VTDPDPVIRTTDLRILILLFSSVADKMPKISCFFFKGCFYVLEVHLHPSTKMKSQKEVKIVEIKVFLTFFACWWKDPDTYK
jgi:hypothetical protein